MGCSLSDRADYLVEKVKAMKEAQKEIMCYCTDDCNNCPIVTMCDWDRNLDFTDERIEDHDMWADFISKADRYDERESEKQFKEATGYDSMAWDILSRKEY